MLWKIDEKISYVFRVFYFEKGDDYFYRTPAGVGRISANDYLSGYLWRMNKMFSLNIKIR